MTDQWEHLDQDEILTLIEGELDPSVEAILWQHIRNTSSPEIVQSIEAMMRDRQSLLAEPEPMLPRDFLIDVEPHLARPMLIETQPGTYRRQQQRVERSRTLRRVGMAAGFLLVLSAGVWATSVMINSVGGPSHETVADRGSDGSNAADTEAPKIVSIEPLSGDDHDVITPTDVVHHGRPMQHLIAAADSPPATPGETTSGGPLATDFAVVLHAGRAADLAELETTLGLIVADLDHPAALVRNFNLSEAQRLQQEWRVANADRTNSRGSRAPDRIASADGTTRTTTDLGGDLDDEYRRYLQSRTPADLRPRTGIVVGPKSLEPTGECQLRFAEAGATHSISIRRGDLKAVLEAMATLGNGSTLSSLDTAMDIAAGRGATWADEAAAVRELLDALADLPDEAILQIPVVVAD